MYNIISHSNDGFGHQLHGFFSSIILHGVGNYYFDPFRFIKKNFFFEHINNEESQQVKQYLIECAKLFAIDNNLIPKKYGLITNNSIENINNKNDDILNIIDNAYYFDKLVLNDYEKIKHQQNIEKYKSYFINNKLPQPSTSKKNIVIHIRLGDALLYEGRKYKLINFTENLVPLMNIFTKLFPEYEIIIHTDGDISFLKDYNFNYRSFGQTTPVLNVFSDFINSDIFVCNDSS